MLSIAYQQNYRLATFLDKFENLSLPVCTGAVVSNLENYIRSKFACLT
jgi:hypothetical protein